MEGPTGSHAAVARALGVREAALAQCAALLPSPEAAPPGSRVRVLQWNILADGLSDDGFLLPDVLDGAEPDGCSLQDTFAEVRRARATGSDMQPLKERFATPRATRNHAAVVDWTRRWARMKEVIAGALPDIVTMQELDHMAEAQEDMRALGYECAMPGSRYCAVHAAGLRVGATQEYLDVLRRMGVAFAPNTPSTCRKIGLRTNAAADDDGSAAFWRASTMEAESIDFLPFKEPAKRHSACVRVALRRRRDGARLFLLCAHLSSGGTPADEAERLQELRTGLCGGPSVVEWFARSLAEAPTLFCLDANSEPGRRDPETVWRTLRGIPGACSVWDEHFTSSGGARGGPSPVTTNKMRGPLSGQARKIGEHFFQVIDHVFFSSALSLVRHVMPPLAYASAEDAQGRLLPSISIPSDHAPVIVDMDLPLQREEGGLAEAGAEGEAAALKRRKTE